MMHEDHKREIIESGKLLDKYGLIALSGGNISVRVGTDKVLITPSGMPYDSLKAEDIVLMSLKGEILEGKRRPSVDSDALLYIFENREDVHAVIHTHQPYATGLGLQMDIIPCDLTTLANTVKGSVNVAPYTSAACIDMGVKAVEFIKDSLAVVLRHHGVITIGNNLKEALYAAIYLEEACKTLTISMLVSNGSKRHHLTQDQINEAIEVFKHYGQ